MLYCPRSNLTPMSKNNKLQETLGEFIKDLRTSRGYTQTELAKIIKTKQSVIARIESGQQNFSTAILQKIGKALHSKVVSPTSSMDFKITGGSKLSGEITTNTSKNGALALIAASLLNKGVTTLHGVPRIEEVYRFLELLRSIKVKSEWVDEKTLRISPPNSLAIQNIDKETANKIRVSLYLLPALVHGFKESVLPQPGGCRMGSRTILAHQLALESLGVKFSNAEGGIRIQSPNKFQQANTVMYEMSDTATVNAALTASLVPGIHQFDFVSCNYQVTETLLYLQAVGVKIAGIGTSNITVQGVKSIKQDIDFYLSEDPIESMMFISASITTGSKVTIKRCPIDYLKLEMLKLEQMGAKFKLSKPYLSKNGFTKLVDITTLPSKLKALPDKIHAQAYPGINSDNLPFFVPIACKATGNTLIHDWMWENRAIYFTELNKLGAKINLLDPHRVLVEGPVEFKSAQLVCPPALRPAVIILIAMLATPGVSILRNVYSIKRGYEQIAERLNSIGAKIEILSS